MIQMKKIIILLSVFVAINLNAQDSNNSTYDIEACEEARLQCKEILGSKDETRRKEFALELIDEVKKTKDIKEKKCYLEILRSCAKEESIAPLSSLLENLKIQEPVVEVLLKIDNAAADKALTKDLSIYNRDLAANIIKRGKIDGFENQLISWYYASSNETKRTISEALSYVGSKTSIKVLSRNVKDYKYTPGAALNNYSRLLNNLSIDEPKLVLEEATKFFKKANSSESKKGMLEAAKILLSIDKPYGEKLIKKYIPKLGDDVKKSLSDLIAK